MHRTIARVALRRLALPGLAVAMAAILGSGDVGAQSRKLDEKLAARGRSLTLMIYEGNLQPIWDGSSATLQGTLESIERIREVRQQLLDSLGEETGLVAERTVRQRDLHIYERTVTFERTADSQFVVHWAFDRKGAIQGFTIRPAQP